MCNRKEYKITTDEQLCFLSCKILNKCEIIFKRKVVYVSFPLDDCFHDMSECACLIVVVQIKSNLKMGLHELR